MLPLQMISLNFFAKVSNSPSNVASHDAVQDRFHLYKGDQLLGEQFEVDVLSNVILNLKKEKASGIDNLTAEHLQLCYPRIIIIISKLFKMMGLLGYVPDAFGYGIVIPISKNNDAEILLEWKILEELQ